MGTTEWKNGNSWTEKVKEVQFQVYLDANNTNKHEFFLYGWKSMKYDYNL